MILQVIMQAWMAVHVSTIVDQSRILLQLLRYLGMRVHVAISRRERMRAVPFAMIVTPFVAHETVRMLLQVLSYFRIGKQPRAK